MKCVHQLFSFGAYEEPVRSRLGVKKEFYLLLICGLCGQRRKLYKDGARIILREEYGN